MHALLTKNQSAGQASQAVGTFRLGITRNAISSQSRSIMNVCGPPRRKKCTVIANLTFRTRRWSRCPLKEPVPSMKCNAHQQIKHNTEQCGTFCAPIPDNLGKPVVQEFTHKRQRRFLRDLPANQVTGAPHSPCILTEEILILAHHCTQSTHCAINKFSELEVLE